MRFVYEDFKKADCIFCISLHTLSKSTYTKGPMTNLGKEVNYSNYNKSIRIKSPKSNLLQLSLLQSKLAAVYCSLLFL